MVAAGTLPEEAAIGPIKAPANAPITGPDAARRAAQHQHAEYPRIAGVDRSGDVVIRAVQREGTRYPVRRRVHVGQGAVVAVAARIPHAVAAALVEQPRADQPFR